MPAERRYDPAAMAAFLKNLKANPDAPLPARWGWVGYADLHYTRTETIEVRWRCAVLGRSQIADRIRPLYLCEIWPNRTRPKHTVSLRGIGAQSRTFPTCLWIFGREARNAVVTREDGRSSRTADPDPVHGFIDLEPSGSSIMGTGAKLSVKSDPVRYSLSFEGGDSLKFLCFYADYAPTEANDNTTRQLNDGGPPPIPPGAEH